MAPVYPQDIAYKSHKFCWMVDAPRAATQTHLKALKPHPKTTYLADLELRLQASGERYWEEQLAWGPEEGIHSPRGRRGSFYHPLFTCSLRLIYQAYSDVISHLSWFSKSILIQAWQGLLFSFYWSQGTVKQVGDTESKRAQGPFRTIHWCALTANLQAHYLPYWRLCGASGCTLECEHRWWVRKGLLKW